MPPDRRILPLSSAWKAAPLFRAATPSEKHARHCRHRPAFALCGGNSAGNPLSVSKRCSLPGCKMGESVLTPGNALPGVIQVEPSRLLAVRPARGDRRKHIPYIRPARGDRRKHIPYVRPARGDRRKHIPHIRPARGDRRKHIPHVRPARGDRRKHIPYIRPARGDRRKRCGDGVQWDTAPPIVPSLASADKVQR